MNAALSFAPPVGCPDWFVDFTSKFDQIPAALMVATADLDKIEPWTTKDDLRQQIQKAGHHAAAGILSLLCGWQQHRESQGDGSWVPATEESLVSNFGFGLFKRGKIRNALQWIKDLGLVSWRKLGPRVPTRYRVNREAINRRLQAVWDKHRPDPAETPAEPRDSVAPKPKKAPERKVETPVEAVPATVEVVEELDEFDLMLREMAAASTPAIPQAETVETPEPSAEVSEPTPQPEPARITPKPSRPVTPASSLALPTPPRDREGIKAWIERVDLGDSMQVDLAVRLLKQVYRNHPAPHAILAGLDPWAFKEPWSLVNFEWGALYKKFGRDRKRTLGDPNATEASVTKYLYNQLVEPPKYADWAKFGANFRVFQDWCVANGYAERRDDVAEVTETAGKPRDIYLQPDRAASKELETEAQMIERVYRIAEAKSLLNLEGIMTNPDYAQAAQRTEELMTGVIDVDFVPDEREGNAIAKLWKTWPTSRIN